MCSNFCNNASLNFDSLHNFMNYILNSYAQNE